MKHTPGPWRVTVGLNADYIASERGGFVPIRTPFRERAFEDGPERASGISDSELEANARLIAAAPELLEVALWFAEACESATLVPKSQDRSELEWFNKRLRAARAAIAKAEGSAAQ